MSYLFTSESVSEGHPDKVADQISDALLDEFLARDKNSKVAIETLCTTGQVVVAGEVTSQAYVDIPAVTRRLINDIGYNRGAYRFDGDSCGILSTIHEQSPDIHRGVERSEDEQGAGDQGMMFGYATNETEDYIPLSLYVSHLLLRELADIRREGKHMNYYRKGKLVTYLRPDAKSQTTVEYGDDGKPQRIHTIVVSTQHDEFVEPLDGTPAAQLAADRQMLEQIEKDVREVLLPRVIAKLPEAEYVGYVYMVNTLNPEESNVMFYRHMLQALQSGWVTCDYLDGATSESMIGAVYRGVDYVPEISDNTISLTTSRQIGETISLTISAEGDVAIEGVEEAADLTGKKAYTLKSQTVVIKGDVRKFECPDNDITDLAFSNGINLTHLYCQNNKIENLDLSGADKLALFYCHTNALKTLM